MAVAGFKRFAPGNAILCKTTTIIEKLQRMVAAQGWEGKSGRMTKLAGLEPK